MTELLGKWTFSEGAPKLATKKQIKGIKIKDKEKWNKTIYKTFVFAQKEEEK